MDNAKIKKKVETGLSKIDIKKGTYALISKSENYKQASLYTIQFLTEKIGTGIYVTLNKPHCEIVKKLEREKVDTKDILFIDVVENEDKCVADNCIFVANRSLTALSLAMTQACKQKAMKYLFFDSVTTLLIYEKFESVEKFIHFFLNKVKNVEILTIIIAVEEEKTNKIIPLLDQLCDETIRI
ncbi:MAG: ATPase domain-containing protein [Nanoarchaeota archaeon]